MEEELRNKLEMEVMISVDHLMPEAALSSRATALARLAQAETLDAEQLREAEEHVAGLL